MCFSRSSSGVLRVAPEKVSSERDHANTVEQFLQGKRIIVYNEDTIPLPRYSDRLL